MYGRGPGLFYERNYSLRFANLSDNTVCLMTVRLCVDEWDECSITVKLKRQYEYGIIRVSSYGYCTVIWWIFPLLFLCTFPIYLM